MYEAACVSSYVWKCFIPCMVCELLQGAINGRTVIKSRHVIKLQAVNQGSLNINKSG